MQTTTGFVYFNTTTLMYLNAVKGSGWATERSCPVEVESIDDAIIVKRNERLSKLVEEYIEKYSLVKLEVTVTREVLINE